MFLMIFTLYVLNSFTIDSDDPLIFSGNFTLSKIFPDMNEVNYKQDAENNLKRTFKRYVTFTTDQNKQFTVDLNLSSQELQNITMKLVEQVKTSKSKLFFDENEISEQMAYYDNLLEEEDCNRKKYYEKFNKVKNNSDIKSFAEYLNGLYVFEQEFSKQLTKILKNEPNLNITYQIKDIKGLKEKHELCEFFTKFGVN